MIKKIIYILPLLPLLLILSCNNNKKFDAERYPASDEIEIVDSDANGVVDFIESEHKMVMIEVATRDNFNLGDINYVVDDTMIIGNTTEINMTISHNVENSTIISEVETFTNNNLHTEEIRIAPVMKAKLIDPAGINFRIIPTTSEEQFLEDNDYTLWTWNVTPLLKGENELKLVVDIIIDNKNKSIQVFEGVIHVYSNTTIIEIILIFISKNWMYLLSSLIIPFFIFLYKRKHSKKKDKK